MKNNIVKISVLSLEILLNNSTNATEIQFKRLMNANSTGQSLVEATRRQDDASSNKDENLEKEEEIAEATDLEGIANK